MSHDNESMKHLLYVFGVLVILGFSIAQIKPVYAKITAPYLPNQVLVRFTPEGESSLVNYYSIEKETADYTVDISGADEFLRSAQKLMPSLQATDIYPDTAGIRPKLQSPADGFRDFIIAHEERKGFPGIFSLIGIESPGLTASLAIAEEVTEKINSYVK